MNRRPMERIALWVLLLGAMFLLTGMVMENDNNEKDNGFAIFLLFLYLFGPLLDFLAGYSLHLVSVGLWSSFHKRHREALASSPFLSFFIGLFNFMFIFVLMGIFFAIQVPALGILILIGLLVMLGLGMQAPAANLGARLSHDDPARSDVARARTGWFAYCFIQYIPIVGWFFTIFVAVTGMGAFLIALFKGSKAPVAEVNLEEQEEEPEDEKDEEPEKPVKKAKKRTKKKK